MPLLMVGTLASCTVPGTAPETEPRQTITSTTQVPAPAPTTTPEPGEQVSLQPLIDAAVATYGGTAGVAVSDGTAEVSAGDETAYPAWSTIKVPIAIAALRQDPAVQPSAAAAIQHSDNDAAETLWAALPVGAADAVLAEGGSPVPVNTEVLVPEFSTFGQTAWSPTQQARFAANLPCIAGASEVLALMGQVDPSQAYGLGQLPGARFKGGWGPDPAGAYVVRQLGLATGPAGDVAVALTAKPASGTYADGQAMATQIARGLAEQLGQLPAATCR